jgi:hypothetical protein
MPKKRPSPEQIVALLRQIEVATSTGKSVTLACQEAAISDQKDVRSYPHQASSEKYRQPALRQNESMRSMRSAGAGSLNGMHEDAPSLLCHSAV